MPAPEAPPSLEADYRSWWPFRFPVLDFQRRPISNTPFVIVIVPVAPDPATAPSTPENVPLMRDAVKLVMVTVPLLPTMFEW